MKVTGWHNIARRSDLAARPMWSAVVGRQRVLLVRQGDAVRAFEGACPHRGADLGCGKLEGEDTVRCGLHGLRIGLRESSGRARWVPELPCLMLGDLVFVRLEAGADCGFAAAVAQLNQTHRIADPASQRIAVDYKMVIENAFDEFHFVPVHEVTRLHPFQVEPEPGGALSVTSRFTVPASRWQRPRRGRDDVDVPFRATAYSPGVVITHMGGSRPYVVITASAPIDAQSCRVELAIATPIETQPTSTDDVAYLSRQGLAGLEKDRVFWESTTDGICRLEPAEHAVRAFRQFCVGFAGAGS